MNPVARWNLRDLTMGVALCAALIALAILQYRWIGQVSEVERARLDRNLRTSIGRLAEDFSGEFERLAQVLGSGTVEPGPAGSFPTLPTTMEEAQRRLSVWRASSLHPQLVGNLYDASAANLPVRLSGVVARIPDSSPVDRGGPDFGRGGRGGRLPLVVDLDLPALALPLARPVSGGVPARWIIVAFDETQIRDVWLPDLVARNFGPEYDVMIVRGSDHNIDNGTVSANDVLYGSVPSAADTASPEKARVRLLEHAERWNLSLLRPGPGGRNRRFDSPEDGRGGRRGNNDDFDRSSNKGIRPGFEPGIGGGPGDAPWHVLAAYKSGPLDEMVAGARQRNLAVSFGILVLTGFSVAMLMLSSRRASALARQQMEFVAGVTHELRTPLAVISSASQNLADGVTSGAEQTRRYGTVIHNQSKRLADTVEQVLRFAGLSNEFSGKRHAMYTQRVEVAPLLEQAIAECGIELEAAGMGADYLVVEDASNIGAPNAVPTRDAAGTSDADNEAEYPSALAIMGDAGALGHCLRNLLSNAAKHGAVAASDGGGVRLGGPWVRIHAEGIERGWVELRITDNGPGIPPVDLPHIFEPFYRGRRATEEQIQGTGLGLSLAKKIVEAHGGSIRVSSQLGGGTTFHLRLPRK